MTACPPLLVLMIRTFFFSALDLTEKEDRKVTENAEFARAGTVWKILGEREEREDSEETEREPEWIWAIRRCPWEQEEDAMERRLEEAAAAAMALRRERERERERETRGFVYWPEKMDRLSRQPSEPTGGIWFEPGSTGPGYDWTVEVSYPTWNDWREERWEACDLSIYPSTREGNFECLNQWSQSQKFLISIQIDSLMINNEQLIITWLLIQVKA